MLRRELIARGPLALLGIGGALLGVTRTAAPQLHSVVVEVSVKQDKAFSDAVVKAVVENVKSGGKIRALLVRDSSINTTVSS